MVLMRGGDNSIVLHDGGGGQRGRGQVVGRDKRGGGKE